MARNVELLLLRNVENLGIVGDIVKVKPGFARNYLRPLQLAETPTPRRIEALKAERARALAELQALRQLREELLERMKEVKIEMTRACNDQGVLYGSVSQRDIADALAEAGYDVGVRSVRLPAAVRRVGTYDVPIQFERDLRTEIALIIHPDHPLEEAAPEPPAAAAAPAEAAAEESASADEARPKGRRGRKDEAARAEAASGDEDAPKRPRRKEKVKSEE